MYRLVILVLLVTMLVACSPNPIPEPTQVVTTAPEIKGTPTSIPITPTTVRPTPAATSTPTQIPSGEETVINPLTGLPVSDPVVLERRPLVIKVENLPRGNRPQYGLSFADLVYEYYTEHGSTRFAAVYYGQDAEQVGPIRSARFFDAHVVRMYKAVFAFGSAYKGLLDRLQSSEFADRLVIEANKNCPPLCRLDPNGRNIMVTNTMQLTDYAVNAK
jgi:hypothetical protein